MLSRLRTLTELLFLPVNIEVGTESTDTFVVATGDLSLAMDRWVAPIYALKAVVGKFSFLSTGTCLLCCPLRSPLAHSGSHQHLV